MDQLFSRDDNIAVGHSIAHQVVFAGPFGVGKTTALRLVSDIPVVDTDVASTEITPEAAAQGKVTTTIAFDYGEWGLPGGARVSLFGVPGQDRFEAMWNVAIPASSAIVLWVFGDNVMRLRDCEYWLEALARRRVNARLVVALTRVAPGQEQAAMAPYRALVSRFHPQAVVLTADPRSVPDVQQIIQTALAAPYGDFGQK
jgi:signal recognition particle receptor subunit beta